MTAILPRGTTHGKFPWNIPQEKMRTCKSKDLYFGGDRVDRIRTCLECNKDECTNCFAKASPTKSKYIKRTARTKRVRKLQELFNTLYEMKLEDKEIEKQLGMSRSTFHRYKAKYLSDMNAQRVGEAE